MGEVNEQNIEVGASMISNFGLSTHIIQNVDVSELNAMTKQQYISNKLFAKTDNIKDLFTAHFDVSQSVFDCKFFFDATKKVQIGSIDADNLQFGVSELLHKYDVHSEQNKNSIVNMLTSTILTRDYNEIAGEDDDDFNDIELEEMKQCLDENEEKKEDAMGVEMTELNDLEYWKSTGL